MSDTGVVVGDSAGCVEGSVRAQACSRIGKSYQVERS